MNKKEISHATEWTEQEMKDAGVRPADIERIIKLLIKLSIALEQADLESYVTPGSFCIIHSSRPHHIGNGEADRDSVIAWVAGNYDGGDW